MPGALQLLSRCQSEVNLPRSNSYPRSSIFYLLFSSPLSLRLFPQSNIQNHKSKMTLSLCGYLIPMRKPKARAVNATPVLIKIMITATTVAPSQSGATM